MAIESSLVSDLADPCQSMQNVVVGRVFDEPASWGSNGGLWMRPDRHGRLAEGMSFESVHWV